MHFIPYAEESGEIVKIGYWIIEEVLKKLNSYFQECYFSKPVSFDELKKALSSTN